MCHGGIDMELFEVNPLPEVCQNCQEEDCYACDHAGERWQLSKLEELRLRRLGMVRAISRYERLIAEIDKEIAIAESEAK